MGRRGGGEERERGTHHRRKHGCRRRSAAAELNGRGGQRAGKAPCWAHARRLSRGAAAREREVRAPHWGTLWGGAPLPRMLQARPRLREPGDWRGEEERRDFLPQPQFQDAGSFFRTPGWTASDQKRPRLPGPQPLLKLKVPLPALGRPPSDLTTRSRVSASLAPENVPLQGLGWTGNPSTYFGVLLLLASFLETLFQENFFAKSKLYLLKGQLYYLQRGTRRDRSFQF